MTGPGLRDQVLLLTPDLHGADGVSCVARQLARAVAAAAPAARLDVWVLADEIRTDLAEAAVPGQVRSAGGHRARLVRWILERTAFDSRRLLVIVAHARLAPLALPLVARGARLAVYLHGIEVWRPLRRFEATAFRRATTLLANSRHTIREFQAANPAFARTPVGCCPPGVLPPAVLHRRPSGPALVLTVGRMWREERYKGHDLLLDIWPAVRSAVPGAELLMVGDGDDRVRLERRAAEPVFGGAIHFPGRVSRADLDQLYADCDLFVMPSAREGFGLVFLDAMAAGRPCIGAAGAAAEIIVPGVTGLLVATHDGPGLLEAIVSLLHDPARRRLMGEAGARAVAAQFTEAAFHRRAAVALGLADGPPTLPALDAAAVERRS